MTFSKLKNFLNKTINILILLLLFINSYTIIARTVFHVKYPTIMGYCSAVVISGSMSGSIEVDDMVITKKQNEYEVSDVIMFLNSGNAVTHRITKVTESGYKTKGDANNSEDVGSPVKPESVIGKVIFVIPKIGIVTQFFSTPFGMMCLVFSLILFIKLPSIFESKNNKSTKKADEIN